MSSRGPSKRIFFLILACILGVSTIGFAVYSTKQVNGNSKTPSVSAGKVPNDSKNNSKTIELIETGLRQNSEKDEDMDGLLNWEETLWGTSSNNPDTDADGTKDGEETKLSRNPLKAGPNDKLLATNASGAVGAGANGTGGGTGASGLNASGEKIDLENTKTAKISRELFTNYLEAKKNGLPIDANIQKQIIDEAFSNKTIGFAAKIFTPDNVITAAGSDLKKYGNDLGLAFYAGATDSKTSEIEILHKALTEENQKEILKLDPIIFGYEKILTGLSTIAVPRELIGQHLELLNSVSRILADIKDFRMMFEDPLVGLAGVNSYYPDTEALRVSIGSIKSVFDLNNITFTQGEYGYVFSKAI